MSRFASCLLSRRGFHLSLAAIVVACASGAAMAQDYPQRQTIRMVVPFAAGGTTDVLARLVSQGMTAGLGQTVIVDNKGGAGGNIGAADVARSAADGYTIMMATPGPLAINQYIYAKPGYNAEKDFVAINNVALVTNVLMASNQSGIRSLEDLIAKAKANPEQITFGSAGMGSTSHLAGEMLQSAAGIEMTHVPYKGVAPAMNDLLSGQIDVMFDNLPTALAHIKDGKVVALGVSSLQPNGAIPQTPAIASVVPGYEVESWFGIVGPAGMPATAVKQLEESITAALSNPDLRKRIEGLGARVDGSGSQAFAEFIAVEQEKFKKLIADAQIRME